MTSTALPDFATAQSIALKGLTFLAGESAQMQRFMTQTGIDVDTLRREAAEPYMLASVLEFLAQDDSTLLTFTANFALDAASIAPALHVLQNAEASG